MNVTSPGQSTYTFADTGNNAIGGIREQLDRLDRKVAEVASGAATDSFAPGSRDRALVEQTEIELAVRANAKSLEAVNRSLGTIIDIKV